MALKKGSNMGLGHASGEQGEAPLMLSVSGMRGLVGRSLTPDVVGRYAAALGGWLKATRPGVGEGEAARGPHVVVGRDSRPSGVMIEHAAMAGLLAVGCRVTRVGVLSTPGVAVMVGHLRADGGLVITASHNPLAWNGLKPLRHDGGAPPAEEARAIIEAYHALGIPPGSNTPPSDAPGSHTPGRAGTPPGAGYVDGEAAGLVRSRDDGPWVHRDQVAALVEVETIRSAKLKVVVDAVHGAGGREARAMLEHLGVEAVVLAPEPTGLFPHPPEPTREHLGGLCEAVVVHGAEAGFAQDPDADRLAIVDQRGRYLGEEYTLVLAASGLLGEGDVVATNLSTSRMIDDLADRLGARVVRSAVGEANVTAAMRAHGAAVGGEGNGGIIHRAVSQVRDSILGMALVCQLLAKKKQTLSEVVAPWPAYAMVKDKLPIAPGMAQGLAAKLRAAFPQAARFDTQDGVRMDEADRWIHVRPSNTEPILRLIAEAEDEAAARAMIQKVREVM